MAMDEEKKEMVLEDLKLFVRRKEYYKRVGKAWKRGYLLYGPPGTGKSSLVAAMANYLKFDVYDLDLKEVQCNSDLRRLLIGTKNRSIVVIEDIDCNVGVKSREVENEGVEREDDKITLSGLLNFIDGLWIRLWCPRPSGGAHPLMNIYKGQNRFPEEKKGHRTPSRVVFTVDDLRRAKCSCACRTKTDGSKRYHKPKGAVYLGTRGRSALFPS
ncbi:hypothetical protein QVD17_39096 [Tagetes erecta]|uniref:ATPase AAA-type core domain-containing protein n=1 Tax=Tagetes erecta TaxID=13708 RepID=A0AAD8JMX9_TARER|nr:hypothetical protein QVD17_39096 [Tagetes erecta]